MQCLINETIRISFMHGCCSLRSDCCLRAVGADSDCDGHSKSFRTGDMASLDNSIDFEAVRESMKLQMRSYMNQQDLFSQRILFCKLYTLVFLIAFIDSMVEEYLQPKAIQSLFDFSERAKGLVLVNENEEELVTEDNSGANWLAVAREYPSLVQF